MAGGFWIPTREIWATVCDVIFLRPILIINKIFITENSFEENTVTKTWNGQQWKPITSKLKNTNPISNFIGSFLSVRVKTSQFPLSVTSRTAGWKYDVTSHLWQVTDIGNWKVLKKKKKKKTKAIAIGVFPFEKPRKNQIFQEA